MRDMVIAEIVNPLHGGKVYKHKFSSAAAIDRWMNNPFRLHMKVISVRKYDESLDKGMPFTLK